MNEVYAIVSTVGGAEMSLGAKKFGGFFLNGSAGSATLNIYNGGTLIYATSAGADANIALNLATPIACNPLAVTCSGTGYYSVFVA